MELGEGKGRQSIRVLTWGVQAAVGGELVRIWESASLYQRLQQKSGGTRLSFFDGCMIGGEDMYLGSKD